MKRKSVLLRLRPEHYARFRAKADARDLPLTRWILQAALAYEAKGARFTKKLASACVRCKKTHETGVPCKDGITVAAELR